MPTTTTTTRCARARLALLPLVLIASAAPACADTLRDGFEGATRQRVERDDGIALDAWWWRAPSPAAQPAPAVVMMHGCSGVYTNGGHGDEAAISGRFVQWAQRLNQRGVHVLLLDSFSTRDATGAATPRQNYCGDRTAIEAIGAREESDRPRDALAAFDHLFALREARGGAVVDGGRVALLGWSHGGSAVMASVARGHLDRQPFVAAQVYYPGCGFHGAFGNPLGSGSTFVADVPLDVHLGLEDDIARFQVCDGHRLHSQQAAGASMSVTAFEDAMHSFDGAECVEDPAGEASPWGSGKAYTCSGTYNGAPFTLHDWRAKLEANRLTLCALLGAFELSRADVCDADPIYP